MSVAAVTAGAARRASGTVELEAEDVEDVGDGVLVALHLPYPVNRPSSRRWQAATAIYRRARAHCARAIRVVANNSAASDTPININLPNSRRLSVMAYPLVSLSACQRKWSAMSVEMK